MEVCAQWTSDVCTTTTQRVPNAMDVWNTLDSRCTNVAGTLGGRADIKSGTSWSDALPTELRGPALLGKTLKQLATSTNDN